MKSHPLELTRAVMACALGVAFAGYASPASAQTPTCQFRGAPEALAERPSPLDSVRISLGDVAAMLCYGRPSARGRTILGEVDPFGQPWRMGANEPTTLHLPVAARLGTLDLEPGSYSLYAIPGETEWTIVVNGNVNRWGIPISPEVRAADVGSFSVQVSDPGDHVETLTFRYAGAGPAGTLTFAWERFTFDVPVARR